MQKATYPSIITFGLWAEKYFGIMHILLRRFVKNSFCAPSGKFREKPFAEENIHFSFSAKDLRQCCQNCILNVPSNISRLCLFLKISFFSILFGHWEQNCGPFVGNYSTVFQNLISFCLGEKFEKKVFFYFEACFKFFPFSTEIFERSGEKTGGCVVKTVF